MDSLDIRLINSKVSHFISLHIKVRVKSAHEPSRVHTAGAYPGFRSIKRLRVLLLLLGGMLVHRRLPPAFRQVSLTVCRYPFILLSGERHCESNVSTTQSPGQGSKPDLSMRSTER